MPHVYRVEPGTQVNLKNHDPSFDGGLIKREANLHFDALAGELSELQELLYAAATNSVLIILQGMDTSGKDGAIKNVLSQVDPKGCRVVSFKSPSADELAHDFLWRVHRETPGRGMLGVFNRSHYEDVLIGRVQGLAPLEQVEQRYAQINDFERMLVENNTILLKFFLHIDKHEQEERLLAREHDVTKAWKLAVSDWKDRERWEEYQHAYELALSRCATPQAAWHIVPSNRKWFRNLAITETVVETLRPYGEVWRANLSQAAERSLAELHAWRQSQQ